MNLWHLLFIIFFFIFVIKSGKIQPNFEEIFGQRWDKNESEEIVIIKIEQNDQKEQNETTGIDQIGGENGTDPNDQQKRQIILKFEAIKEKLKQKGKYKWKDQGKIEVKIAKLLGTKRKLIQKWKNELNLNKKKIKKEFYEMKKSEFTERFDEFKEFYGKGKQKEFVKELGISEDTFRKWKKELLPNYHKTQNKYSEEHQLEKIKQYYEMKENNPKIGDKIIAEKLEIGYATMRKWKKKFAPILF